MGFSPVSAVVPGTGGSSDWADVALLPCLKITKPANKAGIIAFAILCAIDTLPP